MSAPLRLEPDARCDRCSSFGAFDLGDRRLCEECYRACGSCCPEFGADDLWKPENWKPENDTAEDEPGS